jgi:hypothetical protein
VKNGQFTLLEGCKPVQDPALAPILAQEKSEGLAG